MPAIEVIGDRYELRGEIYRHGLAVVYQAHDRRRERAVRIKCHGPQGEHNGTLLRREARLLTLLAERTSGTLAFTT